jgi:hypothetical protein
MIDMDLSTYRLFTKFEKRFNRLSRGSFHKQDHIGRRKDDCRSSLIIACFTEPSAIGTEVYRMLTGNEPR